MKTREASRNDLGARVMLRFELWPDYGYDEQVIGAEKILASRDQVCFLIENDFGAMIGFF